MNNGTQQKQPTTIPFKGFLIILILLVGLVFFDVEKIITLPLNGRTAKSPYPSNSTGLFSNPQKKSVSIVIDLSFGNFGHDVSRLAFAKMLQAEAKQRYQIDTTVQLLLSSKGEKFPLSCFPKVSEAKTIDSPMLEARQYQQKQWLQDKVSLLEPTVDVWEETLSLLKAIWKSTQSDYGSGDLSLPFLYIPNDSSLPLIHQYEKHLKSDVLPYLEIDKSASSCCPVKPQPDSRILYPDGDKNSRLDPLQISVMFDLFNRSKKELLVATDDENNKALKQDGFNAQSVSLEAQPPMAQYCFLHHVQKELIAPQTSEMAIWAAITSSNSPSLLLYSSPEGDKIPATNKFKKDDPRSRIVYYQMTERQSSKSPQKNQTNPIVNTNNAIRSGNVLRSNETTAAENGDEKFPRVGTSEKPLIIFVQLMGEMGNNLAKIAYGNGIKLWLKEDFNIESVIVLRHQNRPKWITTRKNVQACFPHMRGLDFAEANTDEYDQRVQQQAEWLGEEKSQLLRLDNVDSGEGIVKSLTYLQTLLNGEGEEVPAPEEGARIYLPFIHASTYGMLTAINDRYYDRLRELFQYDFDNPFCCQERAKPDESVFHLRNFLAEMPKRGESLGFEELSPNKAASELFANLVKGDKIAFTSRFTNTEKVAPFLEAFQARGIESRVVLGQSGPQDFCFLMSAQKELVGIARSSFSLWAVYLGNATKARLYSVKSPKRVELFGEGKYFDSYNFTNPELQGKLRFELYKSESQDEAEAKLRQGLRRYLR